jgi:hypothetical protein
MILASLLIATVVGGMSPSAPDAFPVLLCTQAKQASPAATENMTIVDGIEATKEVHQLLDKARTALGGREKLSGVSSIWIEGSRGDSPFTYRMLLPDRFREERAGRSFILGGSLGYAQIPSESEATMTIARRGTIKAFAEQSLVLLLRAPSVVRVRATVRTGDGAESPLTLVLSTSAGIALLLELDRSSFVPKAYSYVANLQEGECSEPPTNVSATRRVSFDEYREVGGLRFPSKMTDTIYVPDGRRFVVAMQFTSIRLNAGILATDFEK